MSSSRWAALGVAFAIVACSSFEASEETPAPERDGGLGDAGPLPDACSNHVLFVSGASGNDANDGCSQDHAIKTIGAALAFATGRKLAGFEVRVCGGTYAEPGIRLEFPVSLRGAYNCATWQRGPENLTRLENTAYPSTPTTLTVAGAAIDRSFVVDGFTIVAPSAGDRPSSAVVVEDGARPVLGNLEIIGGGTKGSLTTDPVATVGLDVRRGARPEVAASKISGGTGVAVSGAGSIGVFVHDGAAIDMHDSVVESGNGTGLAGGVGLRLDGVPKSTIAKVRVSYSGKVTSTTTYAANGVWVSGGEVEITESYVRGVLGTCGTAPSCEIVGVRADGGAKLTLRRTAIYGGDLDLTTQTPVAYGVFLQKNVTAEVASNVIHAGAIASDPDSFAGGIQLEGTMATRIVGNTILSTGSNAAARSAIRVGAGPGDVGTGGNVIDGNVFVGHGGAKDIAIGLATCASAKIDSLVGNAFVDYPSTLLDVVGACNGGQANAKLAISDLETYVKQLGAAAAQGNVLLRPSCNAECISGLSCTTVADCAAKVFADWNDASGGLTNIDGPGGLHWAPTAPCAILKGAPAPTAGADVDFFGTARAAPFSMGHQESDACQ